MDESEWAARRVALVRRINGMAPTRVRLRDGSELTIVTASPAMAEAVHRITKLAFAEFRGVLDPPNGSDTESVDDVVRHLPEGGALVGMKQDLPVASLRMTVHPDHLYIGRVGVDPAYRGHGIGAAIIYRAEQVASELQLCEVRLGTREKLESNVSLYLKLGYKIVRVQSHPRGPDRVVLFTKKISPCVVLS